MRIIVLGILLSAFDWGPGVAAADLEAVVNSSGTDTDPWVNHIPSVPNEALNAGTAESMRVAVGGCPGPPLLLGGWTVRPDSGESSGSMCLGNPFPDVYDPPSCYIGDCRCVGFCSDIDGGVVGFAAGDTTFCSADNGCVSPTATQKSSWGGVKSAYRTPSNNRLQRRGSG